MKDIDERIAYWNNAHRLIGEDVDIFNVNRALDRLRREADLRFNHQREAINVQAASLRVSLFAINVLTVGIGAHLLWHAAAAVIRWARR